MTLPDTGPERPGGLASDTREMADLDKMDDAVDEGGPAGHTFIIRSLAFWGSTAIVSAMRQWACDL